MISNTVFVVRVVLLGLWVGAMAGFAFLFAPILFAHVGPTPAFAATIAASVRAITGTGAVLGLLAVIATVAVPLESGRTRAAIVACIALALAFGFVETSIVVPRMEATPLMTAAYESLHRQSSGVYSAVILFALGALVVSSRRAYR